MGVRRDREGGVGGASAAVLALAAAVVGLWMLVGDGGRSQDPSSASGTSPDPRGPAEIALDAVLPETAGPLRALAWHELQLGEWDTRTIDSSPAAAPLRSVLTSLEQAVAGADAADRVAGGRGLPDGRAKVVVSEWQPGLKKVTVRVLWRGARGKERASHRTLYRHVRRDAWPAGPGPGRSIERGAAVYDAACAGCHGVAARGIPDVAPTLADAKALAARASAYGFAGQTAAYVAAVVGRGRQERSDLYALSMPAWSAAHGGPLSADSVEDVAAFVLHGLWGDAQVRDADPLPRAVHPRSVAALGAARYGSLDCLGCHGWPGRGGITAPDLAGVRARGEDRLPGTDAMGFLRVEILAPSAIVADDCPTGPCADMMPRDYAQRLTPLEIEQLVAYMATLDEVRPLEPRPGAPPPLVGGLAPTAAPAAATSAGPDRGRVLYADHCAMCHGAQGQGDMGSPMGMALASLDPAAYLRAATAQGVPGMMPPWDAALGGPLSEADLDAVAAYGVELALSGRE